MGFKKILSKQSGGQCFILGSLKHGLLTDQNVKKMGFWHFLKPHAASIEQEGYEDSGF